VLVPLAGPAKAKDASPLPAAAHALAKRFDAAFDAYLGGQSADAAFAPWHLVLPGQMSAEKARDAMRKDGVKQVRLAMVRLDASWYVGPVLRCAVTFECLTSLRSARLIDTHLTIFGADEETNAYHEIAADTRVEAFAPFAALGNALASALRSSAWRVLPVASRNDLVTWSRFSAQKPQKLLEDLAGVRAVLAKAAAHLAKLRPDRVAFRMRQFCAYAHDANGGVVAALAGAFGHSEAGGLVCEIHHDRTARAGGLEPMVVPGAQADEDTPSPRPSADEAVRAATRDLLRTLAVVKGADRFDAIARYVDIGRVAERLFGAAAQQGTAEERARLQGAVARFLVLFVFARMPRPQEAKTVKALKLSSEKDGTGRFVVGYGVGEERVGLVWVTGKRGPHLVDLRDATHTGLTIPSEVMRSWKTSGFGLSAFLERLNETASR